MSKMVIGWALFGALVVGCGHESEDAPVGIQVGTPGANVAVGPTGVAVQAEGQGGPANVAVGPNGVAVQAGQGAEAAQVAVGPNGIAVQGEGGEGAAQVVVGPNGIQLA